MDKPIAPARIVGLWFEADRSPSLSRLFDHFEAQIAFVSSGQRASRVVGHGMRPHRCFDAASRRPCVTE